MASQYFLLQEDGVDEFLLEDGTDLLLLEYTSASSVPLSGVVLPAVTRGTIASVKSAGVILPAKE